MVLATEGGHAEWLQYTKKILAADGHADADPRTRKFACPNRGLQTEKTRRVSLKRELSGGF